MFDGITIKMGEAEYVVPPLTLGAVRRLMPKIEQMTGSLKAMTVTDETMQAVVEVVLASLKRNYPDMTAEVLEELIDVSNMSLVVSAVLGVSGFVRKEGASGEMTGQ